MQSETAEKPARNRAVAIVIRNDEILVIYRENHGQIYYTFPGGGPEGDESFETACIRELSEEADVVGRVVRSLGTSGTRSRLKHRFDQLMFNHVFLVEYISGTPGLRTDSPEMTRQLAGEAEGNQKYVPQWIPISKFMDMHTRFEPGAVYSVARSHLIDLARK